MLSFVSLAGYVEPQMYYCMYGGTIKELRHTLRDDVDTYISSSTTFLV